MGEGATENGLVVISGSLVKLIELVGRCKRYSSLETLGGIADALNVEMKELFDYSHQENAEISPTGIQNLTQHATKEELKLIHRLIKAVLK